MYIYVPILHSAESHAPMSAPIGPWIEVLVAALSKNVENQNININQWYALW